MVNILRERAAPWLVKRDNTTKLLFRVVLPLWNVRYEELRKNTVYCWIHRRKTTAFWVILLMNIE